MCVCGREESEVKERGHTVRLTCRSSGVSIMVHASDKTPVRVRVAPADELWISSDTRCVAWYLIE